MASHWLTASALWKTQGSRCRLAQPLARQPCTPATKPASLLLSRSVCCPLVPLRPGPGQPGPGVPPHGVLPDATAASSVGRPASSRGLLQKGPAAVRFTGFPALPPVPVPGTPCGGPTRGAQERGHRRRHSEQPLHSRAGGLCPEVWRRKQQAAHTFPAHRGLLTPAHTWSCLTPKPPTHTHTCAHACTCPAQHHHPHTSTSPAHLTPTSQLPDSPAHTHNPHSRQHLHTQTDRQTEGGAWPVKGPRPRCGQTKQAAREPLPAASPGPVPCPPRPAPASWAAHPHTPALHGPREPGPGPHLGTRGCGRVGAARWATSLPGRWGCILALTCGALWRLDGAVPRAGLRDGLL